LQTNEMVFLYGGDRACRIGDHMDATFISAAAALGGAAIGGALSFLGSWIVQQRQVRSQWVVQDRLRRQDLYKEFIQAASKCFADALQHDKPDIASLTVLYEKISRMGVISSPAVLAAAEQVLRRIIDTLFEPAIVVTNEKVRELFDTGKGNFLRQFSESCRDEFEALRAQQF
jgi:hypothetical protein